MVAHGPRRLICCRRLALIPPRQAPDCRSNKKSPRWGLTTIKPHNNQPLKCGRFISPRFITATAALKPSQRGGHIAVAKKKPCRDALEYPPGRRTLSHPLLSNSFSLSRFAGAVFYVPLRTPGLRTSLEPGPISFHRCVSSAGPDQASCKKNFRRPSPRAGVTPTVLSRCACILRGIFPKSHESPCRVRCFWNILRPVRLTLSSLEVMAQPIFSVFPFWKRMVPMP